jgi:predicted DNA-binding transcriptional regulator AlpA
VEIESAVDEHGPRQETKVEPSVEKVPYNPPDIGEEPTPGIITALGKLPAGAIISEPALATMMSKHRVSIKRAVARGELPPPVKLFTNPVWTAGSILAHLQKRLDAAAQDAERTRRRSERLRP